MGFINGADHYVIGDVDLYKDPFLKTYLTQVKANSWELFTVIDITKKSVKLKSATGSIRYVSAADGDCFQPAVTTIPLLNLPQKVESLGQKEKRRVKALPLTKTGKVDRSNFESIPTPTNRPFDYKPDSKTTGAVRPPQIEKRVKQGDVYDFELLSTHTGQKMPLSGTYCSYCHRWFETYTLDSDHIITAEEIGQWFQAMEKLLDENEAAYKQVLIESLHAQNRKFKDFFFKTAKGQWKGSAQGMLQLFNNIDNLVLSCKICNQMSKNRTTGRQMLSKSMTFGKAFETANPMGIEGTLGTPDGEGLGTRVDDFNQLPRNRTSIELHGAIFRGSMRRENRVNEALLFSVKGDARAQGKVKKEKALTRMLDTMDTGFPSDEDDSEIEDLLDENTKETLKQHSLGRRRSLSGLIQKNREKRKALKEKKAELQTKDTELQEKDTELKKQKRRNKRRLDELEEKAQEIALLEDRITTLQNQLKKLKARQV